MKLAFLEKFEEKFYFKTSHYFWHLLTGLGGLALLVGILIFLWGLTPSFKPGVKKPKYPEPVQVSVDELKSIIQPPVAVEEPAPIETAQPITTPKAETQEEIIDSTEIAYNASMDSMKALLPPEKFRWDTRGHWEETWYERRWIVDVYGINDRLKSAFRTVEANDFLAKKNLLDAYISLIAMFPLDQRLNILKSVIDFSKTDVPTSVANVALLQASVANLGSENGDYIDKLATFGKKNPRDGRAFIEYVNTIMPKFNAEIRPAILAQLIGSYYNYFNLIEKQQEATNLFLGMLNDFKPEEQVNALDGYYRLYVSKNYEREQQIEAINNTYQSELNRAESVLDARKVKKANSRQLGLKAIGSSVVFIAFMALFLVVLSIQRNVKMLREASAK